MPIFAAALLCALVSGLAHAQTLEVLEGAYGSGNFQMNVTQKLRGQVRNNVLELTVDPAMLGGDPAPGTPKRLRVQYRYDGRQFEVTAGDFEKLRVPSTEPSPLPITPGQPAGGFSLGEIWSGGTTTLRIVTARYGEGTRFTDVRERLQGLVRDNALSVKIDNTTMGGDPAPARNKVLEVTYEYRGTSYQASVKENATLAVPETSAAATLAPKQLRITSARYGGDNRYQDVRERLQGLVRDNALSVKADNATMGSDPAVGRDKVLEVTYEFGGNHFAVWAKEGKTLQLPDPQATPIKNVGNLVASTTAPTQRLGAPVASANGGSPGTSMGTAGGLRIFYARYGAPGQEIDVRERLRALLANDTINTVIGSASMGTDPAPGVAKSIRVMYEWKGRTYEKVTGDGQALVLP